MKSKKRKKEKKMGQLATYHSTGQVRVDTFFLQIYIRLILLL